MKGTCQLDRRPSTAALRNMVHGAQPILLVAGNGARVPSFLLLCSLLGTLLPV